MELLVMQVWGVLRRRVILKRSQTRIAWKSLSEFLSHQMLFLIDFSPFGLIIWHRYVMYSQSSECICEVGRLRIYWS